MAKTKRRLKRTKKTVRKMLRKKYPLVERALDELKSSHLYGDNFIETLFEVARERVMVMLGEKNPLLAKTIAHLQKKVLKAAKKRGD